MWDSAETANHPNSAFLVYSITRNLSGITGLLCGYISLIFHFVSSSRAWWYLQNPSMEQQACYKFFIFYFLWILHGHWWFKMSPKGLSRITALLDRVVSFLFNLQFYLHILQLHGAETSSHSPNVQILVQKALSVILIVRCKVPGELQEQNIFAVLCLSHYQVLILKLFYFIYWLTVSVTVCVENIGLIPLQMKLA